jgi:hypothetical protein
MARGGGGGQHYASAVLPPTKKLVTHCAGGTSTLNHGGKQENLKEGDASVPGVSEVLLEGQIESRNEAYRLYYSEEERANRSVATVVHKSIAGMRW